MLMDYIYNNFEKGEPIFLSELPAKSMNSLRQEMKKLTDEGKLIRESNGVYFYSYTTILGTKGKMSFHKYLNKKYLQDDSIGFYTGISLLNKYGFTTQNSSVYEVVSNEATTKQRNISIGDNKLIVYKPYAIISKRNVKALEFLELMKCMDMVEELSADEMKIQLKKYIIDCKLDFKIVKQYLPLYPDRVYRNIYNGGLMNELV